MIKRSNGRSQGFTVIEALMLVVILVIIGFTGYYVWHARQNTDKTLDAANSTSVTASQASNGLKLSSGPTFYDCMEEFYANHVDANSQPTDPQHYNFDDKTGMCTMAGKNYAYPSTYTDDMIRANDNGEIRGAKNLKLTVSEVTFIRSAAKADFASCNEQVSGPYSEYANITMYGEAQGKFLYYAVGCDGGYRAVAVYANGAWTTPYKGQDVITCQDMAKYGIPTSLMRVPGEQSHCYDETTQTDRDI